MDSYNYKENLNNVRSESNLTKFYIYELVSNLFFERAIFIIYLATCGLSILEITVFQSMINISMMVAEVPTGALADKIGKKYSLITGNLFMIVYYILMMQSSSMVGFLIAAIFFGIGSTFISGTNEAYLYDLMPEQKSSVKCLGRLSSIITFSLGAAMIFGGYIQEKGWQYVFVAGTIFQILGIVMIAFLPNIIYLSNEKKTTLSTIYAQFKKDISLIKIIIFLGFNVGVVSAVYILGQEILSSVDVSTNLVSILYFIDNIIAMLVFSQVEYISQKISVRKSIIIDIICMMLGFSLLLFKTPVAVSFAILLVSSTSNFLNTIFMDYFYNKIEDNIRATGGSVCNMISSLIMAIVFGIVGLFQNNYVLILVLLGLFSSLFLMVTFRKEIKNNFSK